MHYIQGIAEQFQLVRYLSTQIIIEFNEHSVKFCAELSV